MKPMPKTILRKINVFLLSVILACTMLPVHADAAYEIPGICQVQTDTGAAGTVKTMDYNYDRNTYFSLRDIAMLLSSTGKPFSLEVTKNTVALNPGNAYTPAGGENTPWENSENPDITLRRNEFKVSGETVYYYTLITALPSGSYDCFMMAADLAMILDVNITAPNPGFLQIDTQTPFRVSPSDLENAGYFYGVNGVLAGDATTGEIYYQYQSDTPYPIASTSKLMTCLLAMDAVSSGQIALEQQVTVSDAAIALSASSDGVIPLEAGQQLTVQELLVGALLPSSNECALRNHRRFGGRLCPDDESESGRAWTFPGSLLQLQRSARLHRGRHPLKAPEPHECTGHVPAGIVSVKSLSADHGYHFHEERRPAVPRP